MIILITILLVCAVIISCISDNNCNDGTYFFASVGAVILGVIDLALIIWCCACGYNNFTISDTIKMYEEENTKIEEQMTTIVQNYQGYEKEVVSNIADMEVLLIKFPELKSSGLVKTQMAVYIKNNDKIKQLKEKKINTKVSRWLLYFGK